MTVGQSAVSRLRNSSLVRQAEEFFFQEEVPYGVALCRICLPIVIFITSLPRWFHARAVYSTDGAPAQLGTAFGDWSMLWEPSGPAAVAMMSLLLLFCVTASLGWCTRFSVLGCGFLFGYMGLLDCLGTITKYTVIACHALLLLGVSNCGAVWSIDAWLARRAAPIPGPGLPAAPRFPVWPRRLMQLFCGIVYLGAAVTKMHTPAFFNGDQLMYWMMTHINNPHPLGDWLTQFPFLIVCMAYITIVWEVLFLFCSWNGWSRIIMVTLGVIFHVMTFFTLGIEIFPLIMISIYLGFSTEADVQWAASRLRRIGRRFPAVARAVLALPRWIVARLPSVPGVSLAGSLAAFAGVLIATAATGIGLEHWMDPYGVRRAAGPYTLKKLSPERIEELFSPEQALRERDMLLAFDVGGWVVAGHLMDARTQFRPKQNVICQASFNPPHPDMWVECNLHDSQDRIIDRLGQVVGRESNRCFFTYHPTAGFQEGEYHLVLKARGKEIARRTFTLLNPALPAPDDALIDDEPLPPVNAN